MKRFKITADDYGYCPNRNRGIVELVKSGIVNSASVLVNGTFVESDIADHDVSLGLHFNITEGNPICEPSSVLSLVEHKHFHGKHGFRLKLRNSKISEIEVYRECKAQIEKFILIFGRAPSYLDGHQHVHVLPIVRHCVAKCMQEYGISETRLPYEIGIDDCKWIEKSRLDFYKEVCSDALEASEEWKGYNITFPNFFIGLSTMQRDLTIQHLRQAFDFVLTDIEKFANKSDGFCTLELMCHPGYPSDENIGGCGNGPDGFSRSLDRLYELEFLKSREFVDFLEMVKN